MYTHTCIYMCKALNSEMLPGSFVHCLLQIAGNLQKWEEIHSRADVVKGVPSYLWGGLGITQSPPLVSKKIDEVHRSKFWSASVLIEKLGVQNSFALIGTLNDTFHVMLMSLHSFPSADGPTYLFDGSANYLEDL